MGESTPFIRASTSSAMAAISTPPNVSSEEEVEEKTICLYMTEFMCLATIMTYLQMFVDKSEKGELSEKQSEHVEKWLDWAQLFVAGLKSDRMRVSPEAERTVEELAVRIHVLEPILTPRVHQLIGDAGSQGIEVGDLGATLANEVDVLDHNAMKWTLDKILVCGCHDKKWTESDVWVDGEVYTTYTIIA